MPQSGKHFILSCDSIKYRINLYLYIIDGVCVCVFVRHKFLRIGQRAFVGLVGPRCQPKVGTLACAGRRPAYMLVIVKREGKTKPVTYS